MHALLLIFKASHRLKIPFGLDAWCTWGSGGALLCRTCLLRLVDASMSGSSSVGVGAGANATSCTVLLFTVVRDQPYFLGGWLEHHASVFGAHCLAVVDHSSADNATLALLRRAEASGAHVRWRWAGPFARDGKARVLTEEMHRAQRLADGAARFLVPTDVDELVAAGPGRVNFRCGRLALSPSHHRDTLPLACIDAAGS